MSGPSTVAEKRRRQIAAGGKPRVTEGQRRQYIRYIADGMPVGKAAEICGFSESYATKLNRELRPQIRRMKRQPPPLPYGELTSDARKSLEEPLRFGQEYLKLTFGPWVEEVIWELNEAYHSDDSEYVVLNAPPGMGKSTAVTYLFACWFGVRERALGREPTVLLGHRAESRAKRYLSRLAGTFVNNEDLIWAYGRFKPDRGGPGIVWSSTDLLIEPLSWEDRLEKEPTYGIGSYEGSILSVRQKLAIWDDLLDHQNQSTPDQREKVIEWWEQQAENRVNAGGLLILDNARFGPEDLSYYLAHLRLEPDPDADPEEPDEEPKPIYRRLTFPVHDERKCVRLPDGRSEHKGDYPQGCLLDVARLSKTGNPKVAWNYVRRQMKNERRFRLVWQQEDTDPEGSLADPAWFEGGADREGWQAPGCYDRDRRFAQLPEYKDPPMISAVTVDPAASNFWAVSHWCVYPGDVQAVIQGYRGRLKAPELLYREQSGEFTGKLEEFWQVSRTLGYPIRYVIVEARAQQVYLTQYRFVQEWCQQRSVVLIPHDTHRVNKADPIRGIELNRSVYREGRLRLPYLGADEKIYAEQFKREACAWPEGQHDDLPMHHWFLTFRLSDLQAIKQQEGLKVPDESIPNWVTPKAPNWASEPNWVGADA